MSSNDTDLIYCSLCDLYFNSQEERAIHIRDSEKHPSCDKCDRRFSNTMSLRNHLTLSPMHNYCTACEIDYMTAGGLMIHVESSPIHTMFHRSGAEETDDGDDDDEEQNSNSSEGWEDRFGPSVFPEEEIAAARRRGDLSIFHEAPDSDEMTPRDLTHTDHGCSTIHKAFNGLHVSAEDSPSCVSNSGSLHMSVPVRLSNLRQKPPRPAYTCPLCLEVPIKCTSTKCGHAFCKSCLERSLMVKPICPMCRTVVMPGELRKIASTLIQN